ncbi:MAG TPA: hypothetical protein VGF55_13135 [Gemmataceae bacterium]|jgi:hypothetical protein
MRGWQAHGRAVVGLAFSPADGTLASAADDEPGVRLWDVAAGAVQRELALFRETATSLAFAPDGKMLAAGRKLSVELWDPATGAQRLILEGHRHVSRSLAFAPGGGSLLSAGERLGGHWHGSAQAILWDPADGRVTAEFVGQESAQLGLTRALDATTVLWVRPGPTAKSDPVVIVTDVPADRPRVVFDAPGPPRDAALSPDGRTLAAAVRGDVVLWSLADLPEIPSPKSQAPKRAGWDLGFGVWDFLRRPARVVVPPLAPRLVLPAGAERIDAIAFTPDGRRLVAGSAVGAVRVWDVPDLAPASGDASAPREPPLPRAAFDWGLGPVTAVAVAADGLTAAAGGAGGRVVVWDLED